MAFDIFEDHQRQLAMMNQKRLSDPSQSPYSEYADDCSLKNSIIRDLDYLELDNSQQGSQPFNNDITFGCLIDACVKNGQIERAEQIFKQILKFSSHFSKGSQTNLVNLNSYD